MCYSLSGGENKTILTKTTLGKLAGSVALRRRASQTRTVLPSRRVYSVQWSAVTVTPSGIGKSVTVIAAKK